ncbi:MAG: hypothetical protein KL863_07205 [Rhizobium sp.]|nr:hypothetical protein [Rhizobium sp.]
MLVLVLVACVVVLTFAVFGLIAAKTRLVEHEIEAIVTRKLASGREALAAEVLDLGEANAVMRNLLLDIAENEATADVVNDLPAEVLTRITENRLARRRELLAEVDAVLRACRMVDASM